MGKSKEIGVNYISEAERPAPGSAGSDEVALRQIGVSTEVKLSSRPSVDELYKSYDKLTEFGWEKIVIGNVNGFELVAYTKGREREKALWVTSGIHGNEPAGPVSIADNIELLNKLTEQGGVPVVLLPLCNPWGYSQNSKFPESDESARCISDVRHLLPGNEGMEPLSGYAEVLGRGVQALRSNHPPLMIIDHHENAFIHREPPWVYYLCSMNSSAPTAHPVHLLRDRLNAELKLQTPLNSPATRADSEIKNNIGVMKYNSPLDTFLMSQTADPVPGIVIETQSDALPLAERAKVHWLALQTSIEFAAQLCKSPPQPS